MKLYFVFLMMLLLPLNVFAKSKDDLWNAWHAFFYKFNVDNGNGAYKDEALYNNEHKFYLKGLCTDVVDYMKQNNIDLIIKPGDKDVDYLNVELDCGKLPCDTQRDFFELLMYEHACIDKLQSVSIQEIDENVKKIAANICRTSSQNAFRFKVSGAGYNKYKVPEQTNCDLMGGQMKCVRSGTVSKSTDTKTYASCCLFNLDEQGQVTGPIAGTGRLVYLFDEKDLLLPDDFDEQCKLKN